jgi:hypothetical protein
MRCTHLRRVVLACIGLAAAATAFAGTPQVTLNVARFLRERSSPTTQPKGLGATAQQAPLEVLPICPGSEAIIISVGFIGVPGLETLQAGDEVKGTLMFAPLVMGTCDVNPSTTGTCTVLPGGNGVSFDVIVLASGYEISGNLLLPEAEPPCGDLTISLQLTDPFAFELSESEHYLCPGYPPCWNVPAVGRGGLLALAVLVALIGAALLGRRLAL